MTEQALSARVHAAALLMYGTDSRGRRPELGDFAGLDLAGPAAAAPGPQTPEVPETPEAPAAPAEVAEPGWDVHAFDALPAEARTAMMAGLAHQTGRTVLEVEAEKELARPGDAHLHVPNPEKYVDAAGRVDRQAIKNDLQTLTSRRPELGRVGHGPGQVPPTDTRRRAAPGELTGARPDPTGGLAHRVAAAAALMNQRSS